MQVLLDFGLVGFFAFIGLVVSVVKTAVSCKLADPYSAYILIFLIGSFVQFGGGEPILGFFVGFYFLSITAYAAVHTGGGNLK
jgi:hypothetical protein